MGTNNKKNKSKSKRQAYETLRQYRKTEQNKKHDLLLRRQGSQQQQQRLQQMQTNTNDDPVKIFDILKQPKAAYIPYCKVPPPFRGTAFTRKRKMDAYESAMYAQALEKKGIKIDDPTALLTGRGLMPTNPNIKEALGTQAPTMNNEYSLTPQTLGARNFGGTQPGSEKLIYEPEINVQTIYESVMEVKIPAQSRNPGVADDSIFLNIPQQAPAYMDRRTLNFEFDIQVYQNDAPIVNTLVPAVVWSDYISFVNNLVPSLFKNIDFQINNQHLTLDSTNQAFVDHMDILLNSEQTRETNGSLIDQLYIFEKAGTLNNQRVTPGNAPTGPNAKAVHFFQNAHARYENEGQIYSKSSFYKQ